MISKKINDKFKIKLQNLSSIKTLATANFTITCWKKKNQTLYFKIHFIENLK